MERSVAQTFSDAYEHHMRGRFAEAEAGYRRVLERVPGQPDALHRLGILARDTGHPAMALELIRRAIAANPRQPAYYNDAGIVLHGLGRADDALAHFRHALSLKPDHVGAQNNLATLLRERGELAEAARIYRNAVELRADSPELWFNLGNTLTDLRAFDDAVVAYARALALRESPAAIARFVDAFVQADLREADPIVRDAAQAALATPWARPSDLAAACTRLLESKSGDAAGLLHDSLLRTFLETVPVCDLAMERTLTLARCTLLDAVGRDSTSDDLFAFACALARQCFINGYVFALRDDEIARAAELRDRVDAALASGRLPPPLEVAVVATYFPLHALSASDRLLAAEWPPAVAALVAQQVREPLAEARLRDDLPRLTPIDDAVSTVRAQYEEHPYPRWVKLPPASLTVDENAAGRALWSRRDRNASLDILVAGCGTGQESIEFAQAFPRARVLAVDLSLASLAYAERKARELGLANVEHAQADLTRLDTLSRRFDLVSSVGVLHHLVDPAQGLRVLAGLLAPGGDLLIGLYSERSRADVVAARAFIAERGYRPTGDDIRRCRRDLVSSAPDLALQLARRSDFFVTDECRDLLFHVQEHRFRLWQIGDALHEAGLAFDGFLLRPALAARYASQFPADRTLTDLASWDRFEAQFPDAFAGMYIFWARKGHPITRSKRANEPA